MQLMHFYYRIAFENHYRKDGDQLFKPKFNKYGDFVYAYEYVCDIEDFVFQSIYPLEQNHYWFECLMEKSSNASMCIKMLTRVKSEWLKDLDRNRDVHAFQNGLYVLSLNTFFTFKKRTGCYPSGIQKYCVDNLSGNLIAIKYHDKIFDEEAMEREMNSEPQRHFMYIKMNFYSHNI